MSGHRVPTVALALLAQAAATLQPAPAPAGGSPAAGRNGAWRAGTSSDWVQTQKLLASDGAEKDDLGVAVAIDGGTLVVGAYSDDDSGDFSGSAYVYAAHPVTGAWEEAAKLVAPDGEPFDFFGEPLALDGDTLAVGAAGDDALGDASGSVYLFERQPSGAWLPVTRLLAPDGGPYQGFGGALALAGDLLAIGADGDDASRGAVYVYRRDPANGSWSVATKLLASDGVAGDRFGAAVGLVAELLVAGAPAQWTAAGRSGAARLFEHDPADGSWTEVATLVAGDSAEDDLLGTTVAISGQTVVLGAPGHGDTGFHSGAVHVFEPDPVSGAWTEVAELVASDGTNWDEVGESLAIAGDTVIAGGVPFDSSPGRAYVFQRDPAAGTWTESARLDPSDANDDSGMGISVAADGGELVVGAVNADGVADESGAAYLFAADIGLGGSATGFRAGLLQCLDDDTGQRIVLDLRGAPHLSWDCEDAGFVAEPGSRVVITARGIAVGGSVSGAVAGATLSRVTCLDETTGDEVVRQPDPLTTWDCSAGGFAPAVGAPVRLEIRLFAD